MNKNVRTLIVGVMTLFVVNTSEAQKKELNIIPKPNKVSIEEKGAVKLNDYALVYGQDLASEVGLMKLNFEKYAGLKENPKSKTKIYLSLDSSIQNEEAYKLAVSKNKIDIKGATVKGVFYGIQSVLQLTANNEKHQIPFCTVEDTPRFGWRGMHIDVGRHFFDVKDIKKFIDWLAYHKFNTFHWHLTEDQGWRIEIKKYPKLTSVGAYRDSSPGYDGKQDGKRYGGFYTQEQAKDIVKYATERHITVIPEIDMPGHMQAAITAYPYLGNDDLPNFNPKVVTGWGIFPYILAPKETTFQFVDDVLTEISEIFPSEYIHIGGDEAVKGQWQKSPFAQSVIKREGLKDEFELQSYFIKRVEKIIESKGRKLLGWDEIREGGLSPNATMMMWRGMEHAVASAKEGHDVIVSQNAFLYLNCYQEQPAIAKNSEFPYRRIAQWRFLPIEKVYAMNPLADELKGTPAEKHILGCQGALWSEYIKDNTKLEYQTFPRIAAVAEMGWTNQEERNFDNFMTRLPAAIAQYKKQGVNTYDPFNPNKIKPQIPCSIETNLKYEYDLPSFALDASDRYAFIPKGEVKKGDYLILNFEESYTGEVKITTGFYHKKRKQYFDIVKNATILSSKNGKEYTDTKVEFDASGIAKMNLEEVKSIKILFNETQKKIRIAEFWFGDKKK